MRAKIQATRYKIHYASLLVACCLYLASCIFFTVSASAHVLKTDGTIGAVMHVDPEDDPIVGQTATFFFEFKDTAGKLDLTSCTCQAVISQGNQTLLTQALTPSSGSLLTPSFSYIFPQRAVYTVTLTGAPTSPGAFQSFKLQYDLRVSRMSGASTTSFPITYVVWGGLVVGVIAIIIYDQKRRRTVAIKNEGKD